MFKKSSEFNWDRCVTIQPLTSIEVIYAVQFVDGQRWAFVVADFGIANRPEENVKVLYTEEWHEWPF